MILATRGSTGRGTVQGMTLRRTPTQARARETVEHLVATAGELLAEVGADDFTTNLLAERAGVRIATVYRYFPNKLSLIRELARRLADAWDQWFDDRLLADPETDWRSIWSGYIDTFVAGIAALPAGPAIRAALHSQPELREIEQRDTQRLVARLSRALRSRDPSLDPRRVHVAAEILLESAIAVLDRALSGSPRKRARRIEELKNMHLAYLEALLEGKGK